MVNLSSVAVSAITVFVESAHLHWMNGTSDSSSKRERSSSESPEHTKPESKKFIQSDTRSGATMEPDQQHDLCALIRGLSITLTSVQTQVTEMRNSIDAKLEQLGTAVDQWKSEKGEIIKRQTELELRLDKIERQQKRNNIVVTGAIDNGSDRANNVIEQLLKNKLDLNMKVASAFRVKTRSGTKIIATMNSLDDKRAVMMAKKRLRVADNQTKIFIADDLIQKDEFIQYQARIFAKKMREEGKDAKIGFKKVFVNNMPYIWDTEQECFINRKN